MSLFFVLLIAFGVALAGNVLLLGLPGALYLSLTSFLLQPLRWTGIDDLGDRAWPLAAVATGLWGTGLIPCWLVVEKWLRWPTAGVWALWAGWGVLLSAGLLAHHHFTGAGRMGSSRTRLTGIKRRPPAGAE